MLDTLLSAPITLADFAGVFKTVIGVLLSLAGLGMTVMGGIALADGSKKGGVMLAMGVAMLAAGLWLVGAIGG
jgi:hypothetical protein